MKLPADTAFLSDKNARAVTAAIEESGAQVFFVGGCVRNALLGLKAADIDLSTDMHPERVMEVAQAAGLKAIPTGIAHGTVTVVAGGLPFEVTTFRKDVETDGRRAVVRFADRIEEDAQRRDFTINGLYADPEGQIFDPVQGLPDIAARRVRFIGDAQARIAEDRLRMLRFFRFTAWYADPNAGMDPDALAAIAEAAPDAQNLSAERIGAELLKLLAAPDPAPALASMQQSGLGYAVLPGSDATPMARLVHVEDTLDLAPDPIRRLAGLTPSVENLRLSRLQQRQHVLLRALIGSADAPAALAYRYGEATAWDTLALRAALLEATVPLDAATAIARGGQAVFPVRAEDLPLTGKALGEALRTLETTWIASDFTLTKAELLRGAE